MQYFNLTVEIEDVDSLVAPDQVIAAVTSAALGVDGVTDVSVIESGVRPNETSMPPGVFEEAVARAAEEEQD